MNQLKTKPFGLIGVNVPIVAPKPELLRELMQREDLKWRSFADPDGAITRQWNGLATPTYYLIDPKGTIRHKWMGHPGRKAIDAALEKLIQEAEASPSG